MNHGFSDEHFVCAMSVCACTRAFKQENNLLTVNVLTRKASKANQIFLQTHLVKQGNRQLLARLQSRQTTEAKAEVMEFFRNALRSV